MSTESQPTIPLSVEDDADETTTTTTATTSAVTATTPASEAAGPVIRWAAIVWGLAFAAVAAVLLWIVTDISRRQDLSAWLETLTPGTFALYALLAVGALLLVAGLSGILRRASRPSAR